MLKAKELRDLSVEELELKCEETRREHFDVKNKSRLKAEQNPQRHLLSLLKKDIARLMTVIHEKRLAQQGN